MARHVHQGGEMEAAAAHPVIHRDATGEALRRALFHLGSRLGGLDEAGAAPARRTIAELRAVLEILERRVARDDHPAGQIARQSAIDELRILALEVESGTGTERREAARLLYVRFLGLAERELEGQARAPVT